MKKKNTHESKTKGKRETETHTRVRVVELREKVMFTN